MKRLTQQKVETLIREKGLKLTPQRQAIVEYLQGCTHHPTADDIFAAVNERFPLTSRATVYNTLNWLKEVGQVSEVFEGGVARFDPNLEPHYHFVCRGCGSVEDIEPDAFGPLPNYNLPGRQTVESFDITMRGLCAKCAPRPAVSVIL